MDKHILEAAHDPMGAAIYDYYKTGRSGKLRVFSSQFDEDEIPVKTLFRDFDDMPEIEKTALRLAQGKILDVGAGSGCHSEALLKMGKDVEAIEISPLAAEVIRDKGIKVSVRNLFDKDFHGRYDTILLLMNGSGIIGRTERMGMFFDRMKELLAPGGRILMDSSDLRYLFEDEDGSMLINLADDYYGEIDFQMQYKQIKGKPFDWLYIDFGTLCHYAGMNGFKATILCEGEHYDYLASLELE